MLSRLKCYFKIKRNNNLAMYHYHPNKIQENKAIHIIGLGGTIFCKSSSPIDEFYNGPSLEIKDLLSCLGLELNHIKISYEQLFNQISQDIDNKDLIKIAKRINTILKDDKVSGVVIVQGTNCIEETAYFINLVIQTSKPIIFTGAIRSNNALGFDGLRNLYNAICLASDPTLGKMGVALTFNDYITHARDATKLHPSIISDFSGNEFGPIGYIQGSKAQIIRKPLYKSTYESEFNIARIQEIPKVCVIYGHLGMDSLFVNAAITNNVAGIISAGMGKGYLPRSVTDKLINASKQGIFVIRCSRSGRGVINQDFKIDHEYGLIAGGSLNPQKASILLAVALTKTKDKKEIQRIFTEY